MAAYLHLATHLHRRPPAPQDPEAVLEKNEEACSSLMDDDHILAHFFLKSNHQVCFFP
jgi:hypothetical protein